MGRAIDNDIRLNGALASRHHCRLEQDEEGIWVIDLGSANGTWVGEERIERRAIGVPQDGRAAAFDRLFQKAKTVGRCAGDSDQ